MKVLLVNGSSRANGCTGAALKEVERALNEEEMETELVFIGNAPIADCTACGFCYENDRCVFDDLVNTFVGKARAADGFVFASPVYYASERASAVIHGQGVLLRRRCAALQASRSGALRAPRGNNGVLRCNQ